MLVVHQRCRRFPKLSIWGVLVGILLVACNKTPDIDPNIAATLAEEALEFKEIAVATPEPLPNFQLRDQRQATFTPASLKGKWTFIAFGYINCPDICPTTLAEMNDLEKTLHKRRETDSTIPKNIQIVFVTLDPKRDTEDELLKYLAYFNEKFIGVTGSVDEIKKFCDPLNISFSYEQITPSLYGVEHSSAVVLIDPDTRYVARFTAPHFADDIANWFLKIVKL